MSRGDEERGGLYRTERFEGSGAPDATEATEAADGDASTAGSAAAAPQPPEPADAPRDAAGAAGTSDAPTPPASEAADAAQPTIGRAGAGAGAGAPPPPAPRSRRGRPWALALLTLVLLAGAAFVAVRLVLSAPSAVERTVEFEVLPGWGAARVADELERAGLVRSALAFRYYLRFTEQDRSVGEGLYDLSASMSSAEVAAALAAGGRPRTVSIVVPEGWRAADVAQRLAANGIGELEELEALVAEPGDLALGYAAEGATLEGYLFPATYDVPVHATAAEALGAMLRRFDQEVTGEVAEALDARGMTVQEWVTLASMVQAEAASAEEMPIIAGVFLNRLDEGMLLQSDPTVAYGLGKPLPELSAVAGDLRRDTPWNTYTRPGLPRTPISNPGRDALHAVLEPQRLNEDGVPYLFFLHGTDAGVPVFRPNTNLSDHNRDVVTFLRNDGRR